jgi:hypothetical protein
MTLETLLSYLRWIGLICTPFGLVFLLAMAGFRRAGDTEYRGNSAVIAFWAKPMFFGGLVCLIIGGLDLLVKIR